MKHKLISDTFLFHLLRKGRRQFVFLLYFFPAMLAAQSSTSFMFEAATVPADWTTSNGTLSITTNHYKEGTRSLYWETSGGESTLTVSTREFNTSGRALFMYLRSPEITDDHLKIEFLDASDKIQRTANVKINFKGWRELIRTYAEYSTTTAFGLSKVRFTLYPTDSSPRRLFFDQVNFNSNSVNKNFGALWVLDYHQLPGNKPHLELYANEIDIPLETPTTKELEDLATLRARLPRTIGSTTNIISVRNTVNSYAIQRNADGSVRGNVIDCTLGNFTAADATTILNALETFASRASASTLNSSDSILFVNFADHVIDQGFAEGVAFLVPSNSYTDARYIPAAILNIIPYLPGDERKVEFLKLARWLSEYGAIYYPEATFYKGLNTDLMYNFLPHFYGYALTQPDDRVAIRELKVLKRYLERSSRPIPGTVALLKADGVGFHHSTHYNNYMYGHATWGTYVHHLRETSFNMDAESYIRFRDAVLAMYKMANKNPGGAGNHFTANSLSGRNPYTRGGITVQVRAQVLEGMIEASRTILGSIDEELAAAYNFFFEKNEYNVPEKNFDGYYQFNYSPIGIYRRGNWVVTMRAPTAYFWGAEIYSRQNRFGRYQSHGTMEVVYTGPYSRSGIPANSGSGGWDWNVVPGTTTVHYTSWREMMPNRTETDRFDQKASTTNYAGAIAAGNSGVFATHFVQGDNWGSQRFTPTNLQFKKSVFTFDSLFVCLGTNISAVGSYGNDMITATNLFQELKSDYFQDLILNGSPIVEGTVQTIPANTASWILTPLGTGYHIPPSNDPLTLKFASQTSPLETGADVDNPTTSQVAAKAFIDHGVKPTNKNYHFVMIPGTTAAAMQEIATQIQSDDNAVYKIENQTEAMHAVTHKPTNTTSYAFFAAANNISFGLVKSTTTEHLLVVKNEAEKTRLHFSVSNPDMHPVVNSEFGFMPTPVTTTITVRGEWKIRSSTDGSVSVISSNSDETQISFTLNEGMPVYFTLAHPSDDEPSFITQIPQHDWVNLSGQNNTYTLNFLNESVQNRTARLTTLSGICVKSFETTKSTIAINDLYAGFYLLTAYENDRHKTFKLIVR